VVADQAVKKVSAEAKLRVDQGPVVGHHLGEPGWIGFDHVVSGGGEDLGGPADGGGNHRVHAGVPRVQGDRNPDSVGAGATKGHGEGPGVPEIRTGQEGIDQLQVFHRNRQHPVDRDQLTG
jgi:hypothetical protein